MGGALKAVVFDLDGTLLDTLDDIAYSLNGTLRLYGFPERTWEEVRRFVGNGVSRLVELAIPGGRENPLFESCLADYKTRYAENCQNKTGPYPGVIPLLDELTKTGLRLAVVSNKPDAEVRELSREYFGPAVDAAIGESPNLPRKPDPAAVYRALEELDVKPEDAVYVGDSEVDVQTARNAGLRFVGVTWGFRGREVLLEHGAETLIDEPKELLGYLNM